VTASALDPRPWLRDLWGSILPHLDPRAAVRRALALGHSPSAEVLVAAGRQWPLPPGPVRILAVGKAAGAMARGAVDVLGAERVAGIIVAPEPQPCPGLTSLVAEHPVPGPGSELAARVLLTELGDLERDDELVVFLLSGGGSALIEAPLEPLQHEDLRRTHELLVGCGAEITAMNTVRKHLSAVKGGRLAVAAAPARQLTLIVSDVPDGQVDAVASGPTLPDPTTVADVEAILDRLSVRRDLPAAVQRFLMALPETPKADHPAFAQYACDVVLDNCAARHAARIALTAAGIEVIEDMAWDDAPVGRAVDGLLARLDSEWGRRGGQTPVAVVTGGEVSCPVTGDGVGGRNLHFALLAARSLADGGEGGVPTAVLSLGTDGIDGNSPAAGAVVDRGTWGRIAAAGRDPARDLARCDAFRALDAVDEVVVTGPTGTNVRDLRILARFPHGWSTKGF